MLPRRCLVAVLATLLLALLASRAAQDLSSSSADVLKFLSQAEAAAVDAKLMEGFSVESLMELSGLAVAAAVREEFPPGDFPRVVAVMGPGGNGGDTMVAARHLAAMGYAVNAFYPKRSGRPLYAKLLVSLEMMGVVLVDALPPPDPRTVVLDGVFGFSFKPPLREPFGQVLADVARRANIVSVDVPSGWDVDSGPTAEASLRPAVLVSLTAPKLCARAFGGAAHYLGRVFVPPGVAAAHGLTQPAFEGARQIVRLPAS